MFLIVYWVINRIKNSAVHSAITIVAITMLCLPRDKLQISFLYG